MGKVKKGAEVVFRLLVFMSLVHCFGIVNKVPSFQPPLSQSTQMSRVGQNVVTSPIKLKDQPISKITGEHVNPHTFVPGATQSPGETAQQKQLKKQFDALGFTKELKGTVTKTPNQTDNFFKPQPSIIPESTIVLKKTGSTTTQNVSVQSEFFKPKVQVVAPVKTPTQKQVQDAVAVTSQPIRATVVQVSEMPLVRPVTPSVSETKVEKITPLSPQVLKLQEATRPSQPQTTIKTLKEIEPKLVPVSSPPLPMKKPVAFSGWNEGYAVPKEEELRQKALIKKAGITEKALELQKSSLKPVQKFEIPEEKVTPPPLPPKPKKDVDSKKIVEEKVAVETKKLIDQKAAADKKKKIAAGVAIGAGAAAAATALAVGLGVGLSQDDKQSALVSVPVGPIPTPSEDISPPVIVPVGAPVVEPTTTPSIVPVSTPSVVVPVVVVDKKEEDKDEEKKEGPKPEPVKEVGLIPPPVVEEPTKDAGLVPPPVVEKELEEPMPEPVQKFEVPEVIDEEKIVEKPVLERKLEDVPVIEPVRETVIEKEIENPESPRAVSVVAKKKKPVKKKVAVAQSVPEPKKPKRKVPPRKKYVAGRKQEEKRPVKKVARPKPKSNPVAKAPARKSGEKSRLGKNPIIGSQMKITPVN